MYAFQFRPWDSAPRFLLPWANFFLLWVRGVYYAQWATVLGLLLKFELRTSAFSSKPSFRSFVFFSVSPFKSALSGYGRAASGVCDLLHEQLTIEIPEGILRSHAYSGFCVRRAWYAWDATYLGARPYLGGLNNVRVAFLGQCVPVILY
jgi:hypothetical protein